MGSGYHYRYFPCRRLTYDYYREIEELDTCKQILVKKIADLTVETVSPEQIDKISDYLDDWENINFDDKRQVLYGLITRIRAISESLRIE